MVCMNMRRKAVKSQLEREKNCEKRQDGRRKTDRGRGENQKRGLGNDCSNHRLQVDVLSGATVNLSVTVCAHMSGHKKESTFK